MSKSSKTIPQFVLVESLIYRHNPTFYIENYREIKTKIKKNNKVSVKYLLAQITKEHVNKCWLSLSANIELKKGSHKYTASHRDQHIQV